MVLCESLENLKELLSQMAKKHTNTLTLSSTNCSSWQLTGETNLADTMYIYSATEYIPASHTCAVNNYWLSTLRLMVSSEASYYCHSNSILKVLHCTTTCAATAQIASVTMCCLISVLFKTRLIIIFMCVVRKSPFCYCTYTGQTDATLLD